MPQRRLPSCSLTPADRPRAPPRIPKETQFANHRPEPFRLSLRTWFPSARVECESTFTHQGGNIPEPWLEPKRMEEGVSLEPERSRV